MSVTVHVSIVRVFVLQCLCHSLLLIAVILLVVSTECVLCFVSPVIFEVCVLRDTHDKMVPVV